MIDPDPAFHLHFDVQKKVPIFPTYGVCATDTGKNRVVITCSYIAFNLAEGKTSLRNVKIVAD